MPLSDWFAETVRTALIRELGSLPAAEPESEAAEPEPEAAEPEPEASETVSAISSTERYEPPAETLAPASPPIPSVAEYRARRISLEAQRLAASGLSGWLATRIEGLPAGGLRAAPSAPKGARPAASSTLVPPKPQLDLFQAIPSTLASAAAPPVAPLAPSKAPELPAVLPLSLPLSPVVSLALSALRPPRVRARRSAGVDPAIAALAASVAALGVREPIL